MSDWQLKTPVAFIIFKRPDTTKKVFEAIRRAKPPKLFVIADGPREDKPGEAEKCAATRAIIDSIDWECETIENYSETNLGCKKRVATGLDWVFSIVEEAIIIEDDCLPHPSFFRYCEELLEKYRDDERIMTICGTNVVEKWKSNIQSYHYSYYGKGWGWASWRRAWKHYDINMSLWSKPEMKNRIRDVLNNREEYKKRIQKFDNAYLGKTTSWDAQWLFARLSQSGLSIVPSVNLVENIGFGEDATHTKGSSGVKPQMPFYSMSFPLIEPCGLVVDRDFDHYVYLKSFKGKNLQQKIINKIQQLFNS